MGGEGVALEGASGRERAVWEGQGRVRDRMRETLGGDEGARSGNHGVCVGRGGASRSQGNAGEMQKTGEENAVEYFMESGMGRRECRDTTHASIEVDTYRNGTEKA